MANGQGKSAHRASYTLEMGVWYATCRECGYKVSDPARRRAAAVYRGHIVAMQEVEPLLMDLSEEATELSLS